MHGRACSDQLAYIGWLEICYRADRRGLLRHSQLHPGVQALARAGAQSSIKTKAMVQVSNYSSYLCNLCISARDPICAAPLESAMRQSRPKLCKQVFVMTSGQSCHVTPCPTSRLLPQILCLHHLWLLQGELRLLQSQLAAAGIPAHCYGGREDEISKTTHDRQACRTMIGLISRQGLSSDGHEHLVTGIAAYQRCGVKLLELCATNDTIDLIEERCVHPMLGSCCVFACLSDSPTNVMHSSPY